MIADFDGDLLAAVALVLEEELVLDRRLRIAGNRHELRDRQVLVAAVDALEVLADDAEEGAPAIAVAGDADVDAPPLHVAADEGAAVVALQHGAGAPRQLRLAMD